MGFVADGATVTICKWQGAERDIRGGLSMWLSSSQPCRGVLRAAGPVLPEFHLSTVWFLLINAWEYISQALAFSWLKISNSKAAH